MLLLLTVGVGTQSPENLVTGLAYAIRNAPARAYILLPSSHATAQAVAELVAETIGDQARRITPAEPLVIADPDDIDSAREATTRAIQILLQARQSSSEPWVLNPTSGTKPMSIGATLAALAAGVARIDYLQGQREGGTVMAGTETLHDYPCDQLFWERDHERAVGLVKAGAYAAAVAILAQHRPRQPAMVAKLECLDAWSRQKYREAAVYAQTAGWVNEHARLQRLASSVLSHSPTLELPQDLLGWATVRRAQGDSDSCVGLAYKALEQATHLAFYQHTTLKAPFHRSDVEALGLSEDVLRDWRPVNYRGLCLPGLNVLCKSLQDLGSRYGIEFFAQSVHEAAYLRNFMIHTIQPADAAKALEFYELVVAFLGQHYSGFRVTVPSIKLT